MADTSKITKQGVTPWAVVNVPAIEAGLSEKPGWSEVRRAIAEHTQLREPNGQKRDLESFQRWLAVVGKLGEHYPPEKRAELGRNKPVIGFAETAIHGLNLSPSGKLAGAVRQAEAHYFQQLAEAGNASHQSVTEGQEERPSGFERTRGPKKHEQGQPPEQPQESLPAEREKGVSTAVDSEDNAAMSAAMAAKMQARYVEALNAEQDGFHLFAEDALLAKSDISREPSRSLDEGIPFAHRPFTTIEQGSERALDFGNAPDRKTYVAEAGREHDPFRGMQAEKQALAERKARPPVRGGAEALSGFGHFQKAVQPVIRLRENMPDTGGNKR